MHLFGVSSIAAKASSWLAFSGQAPLFETNVDYDFQWDTITPHKHLAYHECFGGHKCARLQVPMDWTGTSDEADLGESVHIAIIKIEASVPVTDERYGGAIVLNPGGPGGSGVGQVLRGGRHVQTVLSAGPDTNASDAKYFDIIGFDPRGINNSRPLLTCFPNYLDLAAWTIEQNTMGFPGNHPGAFDYIWSSTRALAEGCSKRTAGEGIAKHMSTAYVARDIIEIFERHGEWRENEAKQLLYSSDLDSARKTTVLERTTWVQGEEMVQYWGFSYGTILGATMASMYPKRMKRVVLDAVLDFRDYMNAGWTTNLRDTDKIWTVMAEACYASGSAERCPLYDSKGAASISISISKAIDDLRSAPIGIPAGLDVGPRVVTYADLKRVIFDIVYHPLRDFPMIAQILHDISEGNGTSLAVWKSNEDPDIGEALSQQCLKDGPYSPSCHRNSGKISWDATYSIVCGDGAPWRLKQSKEDFREYANRLSAQSSLIGAGWSRVMLPCTAWHARPHWRYEKAFRDAVGDNKTAHPVLFIGNSRDPVTPLYNAFKMATGFEGAGVLHQNSEGHCTYASPSMCSGRALRNYFQTGQLPTSVKGGLEEGERHGWLGDYGYCEPDYLPFSGFTDDEKPKKPKGETDETLWEALVGLYRVWP